LKRLVVVGSAEACGVRNLLEIKRMRQFEGSLPTGAHGFVRFREFRKECTRRES
jgi:hypothetical protein